MGNVLNPSIILAGRESQINTAAQTIGALMANKNTAAEIALRQAQADLTKAQTRNADAEASERERDLQDQNTWMQVMKDPEKAAKIATGDLSDLQGVMSPKNLFAIRQNQINVEKGLLANTREQNAVTSEGLGRVADTIAGLKSLTKPDGTPDLAKINEAYPEAINQLRTTGALKDSGIASPPAAITDPAQLDQWAAQIGAAKAVHDKILAQQKEKAGIDQSTAEAKLKEAQTPGATAQSEKEQLITKAMKDFASDPQSGEQQIDAILPASLDAGANASYKAALKASMQLGGPEAAQHIVAAAAAHAAAIQQATNPAIRQAEVQKAVDTERATAPIKLSTAIQTAKALRMGDNPAVASVAPAAVGQVQNQAIKIDEDYVKAKAATEALGRLLDLAESGNKAAGSNVPLVSVETLNAINSIKRINSTEVAQNTNLGNLWDQLQGKLGKLTVGKPLDQDILDAVREMHQSLGQQSYQNYTDSLNALNNRTGAKFAPSFTAPNIRKGGASATTPQFKVGDTVMYQGKPHKVSAVDPQTGKLTLEP